MLPRPSLCTTALESYGKLIIWDRYIQLQEEYIKDEQRFVSRTRNCLQIDAADTDHRSLKRELVRAQEEIKRIQSVPLVIGQFMEAIDQKYADDRLISRFSGRARTN